MGGGISYMELSYLPSNKTHLKEKRKEKKNRGHLLLCSDVRRP